MSRDIASTNIRRFAPGGSASGFGLGAKTPAAVMPIQAVATVAASATRIRSQVDRIGVLPRA